AHGPSIGSAPHAGSAPRTPLLALALGRLGVVQLEQRRLRPAQKPDAYVWSAVARADSDVGAMRADDLDDRADIADFAVLAVVVFDRLHLRCDVLSDLLLVDRHSSPPIRS